MKQTEISIQKLKNHFNAEMVRIVEIKNVISKEQLEEELGVIAFAKYSEDGVNYRGYDATIEYPRKRALELSFKEKSIIVLQPGDYLEASKWEKVEYLLKKAGNRFSRLHKANPIVVFKV